MAWVEVELAAGSGRAGVFRVVAGEGRGVLQVVLGVFKKLVMLGW